MLGIIFKKRRPFIAALVLLCAMRGLAIADPIYYTMDDLKDAESEAKDHHIPIVWLASSPECLMEKSPPKKSSGDMTQMAVKYLSGDQMRAKVVLVCINWDKEADIVPPAVVDQFNQYDDGPLQDNAFLLYPKLVISNFDGSKVVGRLSVTEMQVNRELTIYNKLNTIFHDINAQAAILGMTVPELKEARAKQNIFNRMGVDPSKGIAIAAIIVVVVVIIVALIMVRRRRE
jgi:hypothetical protein